MTGPSTRRGSIACWRSTPPGSARSIRMTSPSAPCTWRSWNRRSTLAPAPRRPPTRSPHSSPAIDLEWTRVDLERISFESADAAREAACCVREDGLTLSEVAIESRQPVRDTRDLLERLDPELRDVVLSAGVDELVGPVAVGSRHEVVWVVGKRPADLADPIVRARAEERRGRPDGRTSHPDARAMGRRAARREACSSPSPDAREHRRNE